jgi:hypothetical protein
MLTFLACQALCKTAEYIAWSAVRAAETFDKYVYKGEPILGKRKREDEQPEAPASDEQPEPSASDERAQQKQPEPRLPARGGKRRVKFAQIP